LLPAGIRGLKLALEDWLTQRHKAHKEEMVWGAGSSSGLGLTAGGAGEIVNAERLSSCERLLRTVLESRNLFLTSPIFRS